MFSQQQSYSITQNTDGQTQQAESMNEEFMSQGSDDSSFVLMITLKSEQPWWV